MSKDYDDWQRNKADQRRRHNDDETAISYLRDFNKAGTVHRPSNVTHIATGKQARKGKGVPTKKQKQRAAQEKAKDGCTFTVMAFVGGVGGLVAAGATMRGWI